MKYWKEKENNPVENMQFWTGTYITKLAENEIFLYGSNPQGINGAGAAKAAMSLSKGAKHGVGRGFNGSNAYALVTKSLNAGFLEKSTGILYDKEGYCSVSQEQIRTNIDELYEIAKSPEHKDKKFFVSYQYESWPNGTPKKSLNGYTSQEMLEMFVKDKEVPPNIVFHESYKPHLEKLYKNQNKQSSSKFLVYEEGKRIDIKEEDIVWTIDSDERNPEGIHGAGGAKAAVVFGAKFGNGRGLQGSSYALVTKNLNAGFVEKSTGIKYETDGYCSVSESQIRTNIDELYECAKQNPDKNFLITFQYETWPNGSPKKSLNGYTSEEMFQMFVRDNIPSNIIFHDSYKERLEPILNINKQSKDYILLINTDESIFSNEEFWTIINSNLPNVKEHTMGAGIAKHIKNSFPEAYEADKQTGYGDKNKIGTFSEATVDLNGHSLTIINAYSQFRYGSDKDHFEYDSFPSLLKSIKAKYGDKKIGLPLIGCGLAGGDEPRILKMIAENFNGVDYKLVEIDVNRKLNLGSNELKTEIKEEISFTKVSLPYGWLGNMAPFPIVYNSVKYLTTEALFQSLRFNNHPNIQEEIIGQKSPMGAKMIAKKYKHILEAEGYDFLGKTDLDNMNLCIKLKLEQHPELQQQLLETNNCNIIEDCSSRPHGTGLFWGAEKTNNGWNGQNILGKVWMEHREQLKNNKSLSDDNNKVEKSGYTYFFHLTSPFSNFHPAKFEYKNLTFISNEQFMMYSKAKTFGDEVTANKIINIFNEFQKEPGIFKSMEDKLCFQLITGFRQGTVTREQILSDKEASNAWNTIHKKIKQLGREVKNYDDNIWNQKRAKVVLFGAREKFSQNEELKNQLLATGNTYMVEASPYDKLSTMYLVIQKLQKEFYSASKVKNKP